jgi:hypothetical protein
MNEMVLVVHGKVVKLYNYIFKHIIHRRYIQS